MCWAVSGVLLLVTRWYLARENAKRELEQHDATYDDVYVKIDQDGVVSEKKVDKVRPFPSRHPLLLLPDLRSQPCADDDPDRPSSISRTSRTETSDTRCERPSGILGLFVIFNQLSFFPAYPSHLPRTNVLLITLEYLDVASMNAACLSHSCIVMTIPVTPPATQQLEFSKYDTFLSSHTFFTFQRAPITWFTTRPVYSSHDCSLAFLTVASRIPPSSA